MESKWASVLVYWLVESASVETGSLSTQNTISLVTYADVLRLAIYWHDLGQCMADWFQWGRFDTVHWGMGWKWQSFCNGKAGGGNQNELQHLSQWVDCLAEWRWFGLGGKGLATD